MAEAQALRMTIPTTTTTAIDRFLDDICAGSITDAPYAPDATLDAVVPGWRLTARGATAIAKQYRGWFAHPAELEELRRLPTPTGEVVEYTITWVEVGVPHAGRHAHLLDIDDDGRIVADHVWCGGRWSADLLAQMESMSVAG
jgi:hypothetical protein